MFMLFLHLLLITSAGFSFYFDYNWRGPKPGPNQITATIKGSTGVWMFMYNQFCWK